MGSIYDLDGNVLVDSGAGFEALIKYRYQRDYETGALFSVTHIPQVDRIGNKLYNGRVTGARIYDWNAFS